MSNGINGSESRTVNNQIVKLANDGKSIALIDDKIMDLLEGGALYMTTGEITTELGASGTIVRDRLMAMFNRNQIVRADVHARPNLQRATMYLWAIDIDAFIADGE